MTEIAMRFHSAVRWEAPFQLSFAILLWLSLRSSLGSSPVSGLVQQPGRGRLKRLGDLLQDHDGRIADAALDAADVRPVKAALERQGLLAEATSLAQVPNVEPDSAAHFHCANERGCTLLIYRL